MYVILSNHPNLSLRGVVSDVAYPSAAQANRAAARLVRKTITEDDADDDSEIHEVEESDEEEDDVYPTAGTDSFEYGDRDEAGLYTYIDKSGKELGRGKYVRVRRLSMAITGKSQAEQPKTESANSQKRQSENIALAETRPKKARTSRK